jgi:hypothetical protein
MTPPSSFMDMYRAHIETHHRNNELGTQSMIYLRKQLLNFSLVATLKHKYSIAV